jgi:hypothetical protein
MNAVRVPWSSASFLVYLGGITILFATATLLNFEAESHGSFGLVFWALLIFVAVSVAAFTARALGHFVTAGLLATSAVVAFVVFFGSILEWFGWLPGTDEGGVFEGFRFWLLVLELAAIVASAVALRLFEFPLLVLLVAASSWFFVTDLISGGGDWSAIVTIAVGLMFLMAGIAVDDGSRPFGFWLHVAAGLTIGGGLLWFFHDGLFDWIVVGVVGIVYILLGNRLARSSWVVLGGWGLLQTATYFADKWSDISDLFFPFFFLFPFFISFDDSGGENAHDWLGPLVYALTGLVFIWIGLWLVRRRREATPGAELL